MKVFLSDNRLTCGSWHQIFPYGKKEAINGNWGFRSEKQRKKELWRMNSTTPCSFLRRNMRTAKLSQSILRQHGHP